MVTMDIPNAFSQIYIDNANDEVILVFHGKVTEIMEMISPQIYSKYIEIEKGVKVLCVECQNVIYGNLKAALLFYKIL